MENGRIPGIGKIKVALSDVMRSSGMKLRFGTVLGSLTRSDEQHDCRFMGMRSVPHSLGNDDVFTRSVDPYRPTASRKTQYDIRTSGYQADKFIAGWMHFPSWPRFGETVP